MGAEMRPRALRAAASIEEQTRIKAYQAWLGYYKGRMKPLGWRPTDLVDAANDMAMGEHTRIYKCIYIFIYIYI